MFVFLVARDRQGIVAKRREPLDEVLDRLEPLNVGLPSPHTPIGLSHPGKHILLPNGRASKEVASRAGLLSLSGLTVVKRTRLNTVPAS